LKKKDEKIYDYTLPDGTKFKSIIFFPPQYLSLIEPLSNITSDEENPNIMIEEQKDSLWHSLKEFGWAYPILTNEKGLLADGEQRHTVAKDHKEKYAPILRIKLSELKRRLMRQVMNKLKGEHNIYKDALEFKKIIALDGEDNLKRMINLSDAHLAKYLREIKRAEDEMTIPEDFEEIKEQDTLNECPKCGYSW